jgi:hypothetical protein
MEVAGVIFAVVALFHLVRIFMEWTVIIGDWSIPMWRAGSHSLSLVASLFSG